VSFALNGVPFHGKYKSFLWQRYDVRMLTSSEIKQAYSEALAWFERMVGYSRGEWWFTSAIGVEENAEFPYSEDIQVGLPQTHVED
jgi:hypothetical protein